MAKSSTTDETPNFGTFKSPSTGKAYVAQSVDDAVRWQFDGWELVKEATAEPAQTDQS